MKTAIFFVDKSMSGTSGTQPLIFAIQKYCRAFPGLSRCFFHRTASVGTMTLRSLVTATSTAVGYASSGTLGLAQGAAGVAANAASQAEHLGL